MAEDFTQDRTEAATPRRREEARERGQVATSADVGQAVLLLSGILAMWFLSNQLAILLVHLTRFEFGQLLDSDFTIQHTVIMFRVIIGRVSEELIPLLAIMVFVALAVGAGQAGLRVTLQPLSANWSRLSITKGWDRIFSIRSTIRGVMMLLKLTLGIGVVAWYLWSNRATVIGLGRQPLGQSVQQTWATGLKISLALGAMLLAVGIIDYLFQRWQHEQDLRMSRQDIRDEHKREEGDPQIKAHRRRAARESLKLRMLKAVPEATVVLTNPTHIAVALTYDRDEMEAPRVVAKGTDAFAKRIAAVARRHGVPVLERKPLARALYASVDVDQEIPPNLYRAIAEILVYLRDLRQSA